MTWDKLPRILTMADPHLTDKPMESYRHQFLAQMPEIIKKRKPDTLAILGDLTEEKDRHSAKLVNLVCDHLASIAKSTPLLILMGNHDYRNEGHPFFAFLRRFSNICWIEEPTRGEDLPPPFSMLYRECLLLPHSMDPARDWAKLKLKAKYRAIFAHQCFEGARNMGLKLDGVPVSFFSDKQQVIAGDIHEPQQVGPVTYVGAPYTIDFGDDYEPRLLMLDGYQHFGISLKAWPQKQLIEVGDLGDLMKAKTTPGNIVKIRIGQDDMGNWPAIHRDIVEWCKKKEVQLFRAEPILEAGKRRRNVRVKAGEHIDDAQILADYAKMHSLEEHTLKIGLELME